MKVGGINAVFSDRKYGKVLFFLLLFIIFVASFQGYDKHYQKDSEGLAVGRLEIEHAGGYAGPYGLGRYSDILGKSDNPKRKPLTLLEWQQGYSQNEAAIITPNTAYAAFLQKEAAYVEDKDGKYWKIKSIKKYKNYTVINLQGDTALSEAKNGPIDKLKFLNQNKKLLPSDFYWEYKSQYGLQGMLFLKLDRLFPKINWIRAGHQICICLSSLVFIAIGYFVTKKYNWLLGISFWLTFLTAPLIKNFAPNLYWVEFTWFLPLLIGLLCSLYIKSNKLLFICAGLTFLAIFAKSLCGYEYISTIMVGLIAFPLVDGIYEFCQGDRKNRYLLAVVVLGTMALLGFVAALFLHGYYRGEGNCLLGIKNIFYEDVLRRTWCDNVNEFGNVFAGSLRATGWDVFCMYLMHFRGDVVLGLSKKYFILLVIFPIILWYKAQKNSLGKFFGTREMLLYAVSFLATESWVLLAKSHSYIHIGLNCVLWYFGFVQVCLYAVLLAIGNYLAAKCINFKAVFDGLLGSDWPFKRGKQE